jgi:Fur family transcriptional regulator, ferric uptake regulator
MTSRHTRAVAAASVDTPDLRAVGLKATLPRMRVLEIIRTSSLRHLSAEDVYRRLIDHGTDVGLATVYRVLSQLEGVGLLTRNMFDGGKAVFELNEGPHHDHLICLSCGRVDEFTNDGIEALQREVAAANGYELADHRLSLYGHCAACVGARHAMPGGQGGQGA